MPSFDFTGLRRSFGVVGANTNVGKTLVSAGLTAAFARAGRRVHYVKPWQTGAPADSDARTVSGVALDAFGLSVDTTELVAYRDPVSPHLAARIEGVILPDAAVVARLAAIIHGSDPSAVTLFEGAGGVASPTPEGALQCDALRAVRVPLVLAGDPRLGGISATLAALEMLEARGYSVAAIVFAGEGAGNAEFLGEKLAGRVGVMAGVAVGNEGEGAGRVPRIVTLGTLASLEADGLTAWMRMQARAFDDLSAGLEAVHTSAGLNARDLERKASTSLWWPFTQHGLVSEAAVIESAHGDEMVFAGEGSVFDACASWWTQCLGHAREDLVRAAAAAGGRYGHVMFAGHAHAPAVELAERLLAGVGAGWAARAFYSDNGSTAVEVALKMAFRLRQARRQVVLSHSGVPLKVLGLRDSYHGDTLAAMDAASPNSFNAREPWYGARGVWLPYPTVRLREGVWEVVHGKAFSAWLGAGSVACDAPGDAPGDVQIVERFADREALFSESRRRGALSERYAGRVRAFLRGLEDSGVDVGALLIEPVVQGSGGMIHVDPLFQSTLVREARGLGLPVVYDEIFTGLWRLGFERAADALGEVPDVACYSKSLTGGMVPFGATLATDETFRAFLGGCKLDALLHGHSYTAYPMGCAVAARALRAFEEVSWVAAARARPGVAPFCVFPGDALDELFTLPGVEDAWAHGTVFAFRWSGDASKGSGAHDGASRLTSAPSDYGSTLAQGTIARLRARGVYARPLGNVLYGMASLTTTPEAARALVVCYVEALGSGG